MRLREFATRRLTRLDDRDQSSVSELVERLCVNGADRPRAHDTDTECIDSVHPGGQELSLTPACSHRAWIVATDSRVAPSDPPPGAS
jgi:hypothetical protein